MTTFEQSCDGKMRLGSRREARRARARTKHQGALTIYPCQFCGFFHLGHMPASVRNGSLDKKQWRDER